MSEFISRDPSTGKLIATHSTLDGDQALAALGRCARAQQTWAQLSLAQRCDLIRPLADALRQQSDLLACLATQEMGKTISQGRGEVAKCAATIEWCCDRAATALQPTSAPSGIGPQGQTIAYQLDWLPLGLVFGIMPWNFPYWQVIPVCYSRTLSG